MTGPYTIIPPIIPAPAGMLAIFAAAMDQEPPYKPRPVVALALVEYTESGTAYRDVMGLVATTGIRPAPWAGVCIGYSHGDDLDPWKSLGHQWHRRRLMSEERGPTNPDDPTEMVGTPRDTPLADVIGPDDGDREEDDARPDDAEDGEIESEGDNT